ncbi:MAG: type II toxin-antitoxin system RelE/ParE family toxin [Methanobrevibacter sp.]|jgi:mRNA-degrading endonuclease RelE of RelBE toxin-antitoxin system|nr:type II toxin-antitoxin system RelE/ParE family toxin [Candidatus Methanovirga australis]
MSTNKKYELVTFPEVNDFLNVIKQKDKSFHDEAKKSLKSLKENPLKGKSLKNKLKNYRSLRVRNYRIICRIKKR